MIYAVSIFFLLWIYLLYTKIKTQKLSIKESKLKRFELDGLVKKVKQQQKENTEKLSFEKKLLNGNRVLLNELKDEKSETDKILIKLKEDNENFNKVIPALKIKNTLLSQESLKTLELQKEYQRTADRRIEFYITEIEDLNASLNKSREESKYLRTYNKALENSITEQVKEIKLIGSEADIAEQTIDKIKIENNALKNSYSELVKKVGLQEDLKTQIQKLKSESSELNAIIDRQLLSLSNKEVRLRSQLKSIQTIEKKQVRFESVLEKISSNPNQGVLSLATVIADLKFLNFDISASQLLSNKKPAKIEAKRIGELKKDVKEMFVEFKEMKYKYENLLKLFPELEIYIDDLSISFHNSELSLDGVKNSFDRVRNFVDKEKYDLLSTTERNQLALDNYISGPKSKWQIGRDYELYCGSVYKSENWNVQYFGIEKKLEDLGRDLIAIKDDAVHVIQCKYWSERKLIHEKHIAQLFGTTIMFELENKDLFLKSFIPVFMTNIDLSETAMRFAKKLGVIIKKESFGDFDRIKCVARRLENNKITNIYHLPFDQQYDKIKMSNDDVFFASTVKEVEEQGYRRAFKYINKIV
ncbi:restriction endonuclease [Nonlabens antarcticus]|uniref:restriction endonuclease n=1 Tax=Nonlabens antarcticus TaxID=392714 RepID=UPI0018918760|nr:restriction endonuclease [Nonlabens antarcticus]